MKNRTKERLVDEFHSMNTENKLEFMEIFLREIAYMTSTVDDEVQKSRSEQLKKMLEIYKNVVNSEKDLKKIDGLEATFDKLDDNHKSLVMIEIAKIVLEAERECIQIQKENLCQNEGHVFKKWEHLTWTTKEDAWIDHQVIKGMTVNHSCWSRTCKRCGFQERQDCMPKEVVKQIEEQEKQEEIMRLTKRLNELKK